MHRRQIKERHVVRLVVGAVLLVAGLIAGLPRADAATIGARAATVQTWADFTQMSTRTAGQTRSPSDPAVPVSQWAWMPVDATHTDVRWADMKALAAAGLDWNTEPAASQYREHFVIDATKDRVVQTGWHDNGTEYLWTVLAEYEGPSCTDLAAVAVDGRGEIYAHWLVPAASYCHETVGFLTEQSSGKRVFARHQQVWSPPQVKTSAFLGSASAIGQTEKWWDDKDSLPGVLTLKVDRTVYDALGKGMAWKTVPGSVGSQATDEYATWSY